MLVERSQEAFLADPSGGYLAGQSWLFFGFDLGLFGYVVWGRPAQEDVRALVTVLEHELVRPPHQVLIDLGDVELVQSDAFEALARYALANGEVLSKIVSHAAIVRPRGVVGAIISGFFEVASRPFPVSYWPSAEAGLQHLGRADAAACAQALAEARQKVAEESAFLRALRAQLATRLVDADVDEVAQALGVSTRTLQRRLAEGKSAFAAELQLARIKEAERLLLETDMPVTRVALEVGFRASQHFATAFKKRAGCAPSEYRAKNRR